MQQLLEDTYTIYTPHREGGGLRALFPFVFVSFMFVGEGGHSTRDRSGLGVAKQVPRGYDMVGMLAILHYYYYYYYILLCTTLLLLLSHKY